MFRSLNSRLAISYAAVILVCLFLVGAGLLVFVRSSALWTTISFFPLEATARATMPLLIRADTFTEATEILARAADDQEVRIVWVDNRGVVRFDSAEEWVGQRLEEPIRAPMVGGRVRGTLSGPAGDRWLFVGQFTTPGQGMRHMILFASQRSRFLLLNWFRENLLPPLLRAGGVALVLSILLSLLIGRSVTAPLRKVADAARSIAQGKMETRAPVTGTREARALARSFNEMADRVEQAQQSQQDLVANVSHELKTPLTSIQGFSQALLDGTASTPEATQRAARVINEEAERMRRMVDELLTLARFDADEMEIAKERVDLFPILRHSVEKLTPQAMEGEVELVWDASQELFVVGDADRLEQVFTNLLDNAVAHTPAGGRVTIEGDHVEDGTVEVRVTDTGEGIPPEELPRIFERFYRVDKARVHDRGVGLGLAITKEIVEAHGGSISVESVVGLGSQFIVRLPAA